MPIIRKAISANSAILSSLKKIIIIDDSMNTPSVDYLKCKAGSTLRNISKAIDFGFI